MKDLIEHPEEWTPELREVLERYQDDDCDYEKCRQLEQDLNAIGYAIDWGLDAIPFNLRKL